MPHSRTNIVKQLVPGLNSVFGDEYKGYEQEHLKLFDVEKSNRAFEEEVLFPGFEGAQVKPEGAGVSYATTEEGWVSRYNHNTIALAFAITEEAIEDNLYESLSMKLSKALARAMAHTKQVRAANVYNRAFNSSYTGGDSKELCATDHPMMNGSTFSNELSPAADLSEAALESLLIQISNATDDRGVPIALQGKSLHIPSQLYFEACRILKSPGRPGTPDNDVNAMYQMGMFPSGYHVNHRFTDTDAFFIRTDAPNAMKHFTRVGIQTKSEGEFESGNLRYKARERYSEGWSDPRGVYGSAGV